MTLIIKRGKRLFPSTKQNCFSITKDIFEKIRDSEPLSVTNLNIGIAFKVVWASFIKMGKLTYKTAEAKKIMFLETNLTKSDISFVRGN